MLTEQPGKDGGPWAVLDWRTGAILATIIGGQKDYETTWRGGWTDVSWIGAWLEDLADGSRTAADWPEALPPPPPAPDAPAPLALPLPGSLAALLEETIETWTVAAGVTPGRAAEVAQLTGWTEDQVLACNASWLSFTGDQYMRLGEAEGEPRDDRGD